MPPPQPCPPLTLSNNHRTVSAVNLPKTSSPAAREMPRPGTRGDRCHQPNFKSHFFVSDAHTRFLVDTGSEVSAIPPTPADRSCSPDPLALTAVNNTSICTYGKCSLTLNLGLRCSLPWIFVIADVSTFFDTMDSWLRCTSTNTLTHTLTYKCRAFSPLASSHVPPSVPRINLPHPPVRLSQVTSRCHPPH